MTAESDDGFFVATTLGIQPLPDTRPIDWSQVHASTRFRATPTSVGLLGRLLLVTPPWTYAVSLLLDSLHGSYRAFGYSYDGLILGISVLWTKAVFARSRVGS